MDEAFVSRKPSLEDCWRGIILFGRNVASYKFALGKALLTLKPGAGRLVRLEELAEPFAAEVCRHLQTADKQGTFARSRFLDACRKANAGELSREDLLAQTIRYGFNNVIDAFHVVGRDEVPVRFFIDERKTRHGILITDEFSRLGEGSEAASLPVEAESRWRLVETAWQLGVSRSLVTVEYDSDTEALFSVDSSRRRRPVTGSRPALNGYQKGHCFYCFASIAPVGPVLPDVDHFFPHALKTAGFRGIDGVWNLVLACRVCNRGINGKWDRVPSLKLLERLRRRNEFLIESHHPLRETLIVQTGSTEAERRGYLGDFHQRAHATLIHAWEPAEVREALF
jgi:hypothetical protein